MSQTLIDIQAWLDTNLWLTLIAFCGLYCVGWGILLSTVIVEAIFAKPSNRIEKVANKIYPFCHNLCRWTIYAGVAFIILAIILTHLLPLIFDN